MKHCEITGTFEIEGMALDLAKLFHFDCRVFDMGHDGRFAYAELTFKNPDRQVTLTNYDALAFARRVFQGVTK